MCMTSLPDALTARFRTMHRTVGAILIAAIACRSEPPHSDTATNAQSSSADRASTNCDIDARQLVERLGTRMRLVSVLAPDSIIRRDLARAYAGLVAPPLLVAWQRAPRSAPGREVSSPWPARIDIHSITAEGGDCRVDGDIEYVTTADTMTALDRRPVKLTVANTDGWRVTSYEAAPVAAAPRANDRASAAAKEAADVVRAYYADINARNYSAAYARWGRDGQASGKTEADFATGFADTKSVIATVGDATSIEGAAGSQYATIPVTVDAVLTNRTRQRFTGTYTVRRAMVDGASAAQRQWHLEAAQLTVH